MTRNFDLFGHPVREGHGKRGRPPFEPSERDCNKIKLLLALGWSIKRIANGIGVSPATVKRHFRADLRERDAMRDRLDARRFEIAMDLANAGNVAALKELGKMIDASDLRLTQAAFGDRPEDEPEVREKEKLGKKQIAEMEAETAGEDSEWGEDLRFRGSTVQ